MNTLSKLRELLGKATPDSLGEYNARADAMLKMVAIDALPDLLAVAEGAAVYASAEFGTTCVACGQHRVYTHLPNCPLGRLTKEIKP